MASTYDDADHYSVVHDAFNETDDCVTLDGRRPKMAEAQ
jgi:hypothetical protein